MYEIFDGPFGEAREALLSKTVRRIRPGKPQKHSSHDYRDDQTMTKQTYIDAMNKYGLNQDEYAYQDALKEWKSENLNKPIQDKISFADWIDDKLNVDEEEDAVIRTLRNALGENNQVLISNPIIIQQLVYHYNYNKEHKFT